MRAFCATCRTMREVMDEYPTDTGERLGDRPREYVARPLGCGHGAEDGGGLPYQPQPIDRRREQAAMDRVAGLQAFRSETKDGATE